jgi:DNA repair exonuclease SbcCD ATPase subunit
MNNLKLEEEHYRKKIADLEYEKSSLLQKNKLLEKNLESLTNKYNELKNELLDIEQHINFCKENQLRIIDISQKDQSNQKEINANNFYTFKSKIKTILEYDDDFMKIDSDATIFNMIIDDIKDIKNENLELKQNLEDLNKLNLYNNNNIIYNNDNDFNINDNKKMDILSPITYKKNINVGNMRLGLENDSFISDDKEKILRNNNNYINNYDNTYNMNNQPYMNNNLDENFENIERRCINSNRHLNNLINNVDNMKAFLNDIDYNELPPSKNNYTNKNYLSSINKHRLCHKYI